jgi:Zn ribbon nucleic-acid-binding protein
VGFYKELAMQQHERRCSTVDGWVCAACFDDDVIEAFIAENAQEHECSYCGARSDRPIAADADDVANLIMEAVLTEWVDPAEESPHDTAEGGYLWNTSEFDDVLEQVGNPILTFEFQEALTTATWDHMIRWLKRDYVAPHLDEAMSYDWARLAELVKWRCR